MILSAKILPGLPAYGPMATAFPAAWGVVGRESTVVEFHTSTGKWVGNFKPGCSGVQLASLHPNGTSAVVISSGDLWIVDADDRSAKNTLSPILDAFEVNNPIGWIFNLQGLALARFSSQGLIWHTRRLSWDGFDELSIAGDRITGLAWSAIDNCWRPFEVDTSTGASHGGGYFSGDPEGWEKLDNSR